MASLSGGIDFLAVGFAFVDGINQRNVKNSIIEDFDGKKHDYKLKKNIFGDNAAKDRYYHLRLKQLATSYVTLKAFWKYSPSWAGIFGHTIVYTENHKIAKLTIQQGEFGHARVKDGDIGEKLVVGTIKNVITFRLGVITDLTADTCSLKGRILQFDDTGKATFRAEEWITLERKRNLKTVVVPYSRVLGLPYKFDLDDNALTQQNLDPDDLPKVIEHIYWGIVSGSGSGFEKLEPLKKEITVR